MAGKAEAGRRPRRWNRWRVAGWGGAAGLLLLPLLAMQFTDEVNWGPADFLFAGVLVACVGLAYELAARSTGNRAYRAGVGVALAGAFILVWANLALGIIGAEHNPVNLMFYGVLGVGIVGAVVGRFRALGLARASLAMAVAQVLVAVTALAGGSGFAGAPSLLFVAFWVTSAWLFRKAGKEQRSAGAAPGTA
jgi:MFS family permease